MYDFIDMKYFKLVNLEILRVDESLLGVEERG